MKAFIINIITINYHNHVVKKCKLKLLVKNAMITAFISDLVTNRAKRFDFFQLCHFLNNN